MLSFKHVIWDWRNFCFNYYIKADHVNHQCLPCLFFFLFICPSKFLLLEYVSVHCAHWKIIHNETEKSIAHVRECDFKWLTIGLEWALLHLNTFEEVFLMSDKVINWSVCEKYCVWLTLFTFQSVTFFLPREFADRLRFFLDPPLSLGLMCIQTH